MYCFRGKIDCGLEVARAFLRCRHFVVLDTGGDKPGRDEQEAGECRPAIGEHGSRTEKYRPGTDEIGPGTEEVGLGTEEDSPGTEEDVLRAKQDGPEADEFGPEEEETCSGIEDARLVAEAVC